MVVRTKTPVIVVSSNKNDAPKQKEYNLFIGEWTQEDTNHMCNPRPKKAKELEEKRKERLEKYHSKKNKS